ncbi:MAG: LamG-like jellyroll fold domain-containing protein, partial [Planctomycetota bacterium]
MKDSYNDEENWLCDISGGGEEATYHLLVGVGANNQEVYFRAGNDSCDVLVWDLDGRNADDIEGWHHWVFVKDEAADTMSIWFDGEEKASKTAVDDTLANLQNTMFRIGASTWENYEYAGAMDEFKFFDYGKSEKEVQALFREEGLEFAWKPHPYDNEKEVLYDRGLDWSPGDYADSHDVFLGTNWDDVNDVNSSNYASYPNVDYSHTDACNYAPGLLDLSQMYYWRVDEVSDTCDASPWKGNIWKFTVAGYIVIDDMEDYTGSWAGEGDHPLDEGWSDYYGNGTNSLLTLQTNSPVRGKQSMEFFYDNAYIHSLGSCSEAQSLELSPTDWTDQDVMVLSLWFYGDPGNDAAGDANQMYVSVIDDDGLYAELRYGDNEGEDMNDIKIEAWQLWDAPLTYFSDGNFAAVANDVNLADVNMLVIGFGERNGSQLGGSGYVWFDDIRLYPASCRPDKGQPEGDLNYDCTVDFEDVEIMADEWLEADVNLGEVKEPCDANLVGWWKLDDGSGSTATDSSGKNHNGTIQILDANVSWVSGRNDVNSALEFDGGRVRVP